MKYNAVEAFFRDHHARFSASTIRGYKVALNQFFTFCSKQVDLVKATDIRAWLASMEEQQLKPRTIALKIAALKSFYKYCTEENIVKKNPTVTVHKPTIDDSLPYYLSKRQIARLQEHTKNDVRDRAMIEALYTTGVRISELLHIKLEDVKWDSRQIWIRKGKGNQERFVLFTYDCAERLKTYLNNRGIKSEYLFCNRYGEKMSYSFIKKRFDTISKDIGFVLKPHIMRHTFAAHLAEKNMPQSYIQELLGHANINSTRVYTRLMEHVRKKKYDRYQ